MTRAKQRARPDCSVHFQRVKAKVVTNLASPLRTRHFRSIPTVYAMSVLWLATFLTTLTIFEDDMSYFIATTVIGHSPAEVARGKRNVASSPTPYSNQKDFIAHTIVANQLLPNAAREAIRENYSDRLDIEIAKAIRAVEWTVSTTNQGTALEIKAESPELAVHIADLVSNRVLLHARQRPPSYEQASLLLQQQWRALEAKHYVRRSEQIIKSMLCQTTQYQENSTRHLLSSERSEDPLVKDSINRTELPSHVFVTDPQADLIFTSPTRTQRLIEERLLLRQERTALTEAQAEMIRFEQQFDLYQTNREFHIKTPAHVTDRQFSRAAGPRFLTVAVFAVGFAAICLWLASRSDARFAIPLEVPQATSGQTSLAASNPTLQPRANHSASLSPMSRCRMIVWASEFVLFGFSAIFTTALLKGEPLSACFVLDPWHAITIASRFTGN